MTEQVEGIGIGLLRLHRELVEIDATISKLANDLSAFFGIAPPGAQVLAAGAERPDLFASIVRELDCAQLFAVGVEFVHEFGINLDLATVEIELPPRLEGRGVNDYRRLTDFGFLASFPFDRILSLGL